MKLNQDLGELSTGGKAALLGALALCCLVPMLLVFGAVSLTGAIFGGGAVVVVGLVAILAWTVWMSRHHRAMVDQPVDAGEDGPEGRSQATSGEVSDR